MIIGLDAGRHSVRDAERLLTALPLGAATMACTHFIRTGTPHVALSVSVPDDVDPTALEPEISFAAGDLRRGPLAASAALAAAAHGTGGRAVLFPGSAMLTGTVAVADVLARTAIDEIRVLGGGSHARLLTRDFVRPEWTDGRLVLAATPVGPDTIAPFELPNPTPCCADHD